MKRNFEKILLGVLWLMTVALATTFWMHVRYGFDIFSAAHWEYISGLQAYRANIKLEFYLSLIFALCIGLCGLYIIVRPRQHKIQTGRIQWVQHQPMATVQPQVTPTTRTPEPMTQPVQPTNTPTGPTSTMRPISPSSLQTKTVRRPTPPQQFAPPKTPGVPVVPAPKPQTINPLAEKINAIFESVGYVMKPCKKIGNLREPVVALGYDQTLWIGASDIPSADMLDAIQTLVTVFDDTLGDSANDIKLHGCIINPTDTSNNELISCFNSIDDFNQFMAGHKNTKPNDFDNELFDAISTYISTVASYIGKE